MSMNLNLEITEDVYASLLKIAEKTGQQPEKLAVQWLTSATHSMTNDPLEQFIGAFKSNSSDWASNHDKYIGQSQQETNE